MDERIKKLWVKELRSDKYTQGLGSLCYIGGSSEEHCCLGVLCEVAAKEGIVSIREDGHYRSFGDEEILLPRSVVNWADLPDANPVIDPENNVGAAEANDHGVPFTAIADLIEANL
jgi:hypothetical protein